jgi:hypothetical protein
MKIEEGQVISKKTVRGVDYEYHRHGVGQKHEWHSIVVHPNDPAKRNAPHVGKPSYVSKKWSEIKEEMEMTLVKDIVAAAQAQQPIEFKKAFDMELGNRVVTALDGFKDSLSKEVFNFAGDVSTEINSQGIPSEQDPGATGDGQDS